MAWLCVSCVFMVEFTVAKLFMFDGTVTVTCVWVMSVLSCCSARWCRSCVQKRCSSACSHAGRTVKGRPCIPVCRSLWTTRSPTLWLCCTLMSNSWSSTRRYDKSRRCGAPSSYDPAVSGDGQKADTVNYSRYICMEKKQKCITRCNQTKTHFKKWKEKGKIMQK